MKKVFFLFTAFLLTLQLHAQGTSLLNSIKAANSKVKSIESDVSKIHNKSNKTTSQNGKFYFVSPKEFAALFTTGKHMIVNEKNIKIDMGIMHGTFKLKEGGMMQSLSNIFLYGFQGRIQELADENDYSLSTETENEYHVVTGSINKKKLIGIGYKRVVFKFDRKSLLLRQIVLYDYKGNVDTYTISNVKYNGTIDKKTFQF